MTTPLALAAAAALFVCRLGLFALLHLRPGGIDPLRHAVSDYARSTSPATRRLATAASRAAAAAWAVLGLAALTVPAPARSVPLGLWLLALAAVLATMPHVPTDGPGAETTPLGRLHMVLAVAWFTIAYSTIGPTGDLLVRLTGAAPPGLALLDHVAAVALVCLVVSLVVRPLRSRTFGVSERAFILAVTLAPLVSAVALARA
ncbi:DUF998 domain-containing protein [Janibacter sp. G349]|uniref:DUF998 domain-containing protein n=1 Tax=Janibacter sp. G349 TaxID=3405424 RepID=UPI003B7831AC